jgi:hypothetical protein
VGLRSAGLTSEAVQEDIQVIDAQFGEIADDRQLHLPHERAEAISILEGRPRIRAVA